MEDTTWRIPISGIRQSFSGMRQSQYSHADLYNQNTQYILRDPTSYKKDSVGNSQKINFNYPSRRDNFTNLKIK